MNDPTSSEAYRRAIEFLLGLRVFGANFGLETTLRLAAAVGNPHERLRFIHVAGTNGKGSTCAMLESIYRAAGLRVGLFTSPHLVSFSERIQVNRRLIPEADVARLVERLSVQCRTRVPPAPTGTDRRDASPTFFEFVTVMALQYFAEQKCDLVIWETGLGGRLDATNIVAPLASVITNIGLDHSEWLGDTIDRIAAEKAGIIKLRVPVITAATPGAGLEVIANTAHERRAPLTIVDPAQTERWLKQVELPLRGPHQRTNAATALATVSVLNQIMPVSDADARKALATVHWPARMQVVQAPNQTIVLDGAHNPAGAEALRVALEIEFPNRRPAMIVGVFRDKDWRSMARSLAPLADRIVLTPVHSDRSEDPARLAAACRELKSDARIEIASSLDDALKRTGKDPFVVVAGSLYLVGEAMELLKVTAGPGGDEKRLNEWAPKEGK